MPDKGTAQDAAQTEREQELHSMVAEGMECIRHLRDLNDRIEEEAISEAVPSGESVKGDLRQSAGAPGADAQNA